MATHDHHHDHSACIALAWFDAQQWQQLKELADDRDQLEDSYDEWLAAAKKSERQLHDAGLHAHRIPLDVATLQRWCIARKRPLDGKARSEYAIALSRRMQLG